MYQYTNPQVVTLNKKKNEYGEYKITFFDVKTQKYIREATYYTDDWEDAICTFQVIALEYINKELILDLNGQMVYKFIGERKVRR